jgi:hypothetical protein
MDPYLTKLAEAAVHADNFDVVVTSTQRSHFEAAVAMAMSDHRKLTHYRVSTRDVIGRKKLLLYWAPPSAIAEKADTYHALPYEMNAEAAIEFAWQWLRSLSREDHSQRARGQRLGLRRVRRHGDLPGAPQVSKAKRKGGKYMITPLSSERIAKLTGITKRDAAKTAKILAASKAPKKSKGRPKAALTLPSKRQGVKPKTTRTGPKRKPSRDSKRQVDVIGHKPHCIPCGTIPPLYSEKYDCYACPECKRWLETKCSDKQCQFCNVRPAEPPEEMFAVEPEKPKTPKETYDAEIGGTSSRRRVRS